MGATEEPPKEPSPFAPPPPLSESPPTATAPDAPPSRRGWIAGILGVVLCIGVVGFVVVERWLYADALAAAVERDLLDAQEARESRARLAQIAEDQREVAREQREADEARRRAIRLEREREGVEASRVAQIMAEETAGAVLDRRFRHYLENHPRLRGAASPEEATRVAYALGRDIGNRGLARLNGEDLEEMARLQLLVSRADESLCAKLWSGDVSQAEITAALATLSEPDLRSWFQISARAIDLQLDEPESVPTVDRAAMADGLDRIAEHLEPRDRVRFEAASAAVAEDAIGDEEACFFVTTVLTESATLDRALRTRFLSALMAANAGEG